MQLQRAPSIAAVQHRATSVRAFVPQDGDASSASVRTQTARHSEHSQKGTQSTDSKTLRSHTARHSHHSQKGTDNTLDVRCTYVYNRLHFGQHTYVIHSASIMGLRDFTREWWVVTTPTCPSSASLFMHTLNSLSNMSVSEREACIRFTICSKQKLTMRKRAASPCSAYDCGSGNGENRDRQTQRADKGHKIKHRSVIHPERVLLQTAPEY